jgi:hypothetical protein
VDRTVLIPSTPVKVVPENVKKRTGISFVPLYAESPAIQKTRHGTTCHQFTEEEIVLFQRRFEEGYDLKDDEKYNVWRNMYHPEHQPALQDNSLPCQTVLSKLITETEPKIKLPAKETKTTARILTSQESYKILQEKEEKKQGKLAKKLESQRKKQEKRELQQKGMSINCIHYITCIITGSCKQKDKDKEKEIGGSMKNNGK